MENSFVVKIVADDDRFIPRYESGGAAGADLRYNGKTIILGPLERNLFDVGFTVALPPGVEMQIRPRSGLSLKQGVTVLNAPGTIDSDYRGRVGVILVNLSNDHVTIKDGDRIAQAVINVVGKGSFDKVESLDETDRGTGGFGSTGEK